MGPHLVQSRPLSPGLSGGHSPCLVRPSASPGLGRLRSLLSGAPATADRNLPSQVLSQAWFLAEGGQGGPPACCSPAAVSSLRVWPLRSAGISRARRGGGGAWEAQLRALLASADPCCPLPPQVVPDPGSTPGQAVARPLLRVLGTLMPLRPVLPNWLLPWVLKFGLGLQSYVCVCSLLSWNHLP